MTNRNSIIQWVAALESGNYTQAQQALAKYENDQWSYCCLGVACVTAGMDPIFDDQIDEPYFDATGEFLPVEAQNWLGVADEDLVLDIPLDLRHRAPMPGNLMHQTEVVGATARATFLNDVYGLTFAEIARCIRHTYDIRQENL